MTTLRPVWEIFADLNASSLLDPWAKWLDGAIVENVNDLLHILGADENDLEDQTEALIDFIDMPIAQSAPDWLIDEINEFFLDRVSASARPASFDFDPDEARDDKGEWTIGGGGGAKNGSEPVFAKTQARVRLQALSNQARELSGAAKMAAVVIRVQDKPTAYTKPPYTNHTAKDSKTLTILDPATASDNIDVKTEGSIVHITVTTTGATYVGWMGTAKDPPILLTDKDGKNFYNADGTPAEGKTPPPPATNKTTGPKTPKTTPSTTPSITPTDSPPTPSTPLPQGDHTGKDFTKTLDVTGMKTNEASIQAIEKAQLVVSGKVGDYLPSQIDPQDLKANLVNDIAIRMGDKYDAQLMNEEYVKNIDPVTGYAAAGKYVNQSQLLTHDDVWSKSNHARYEYLGNVNTNPDLKRVDTDPVLKSGGTMIHGDTPEIAIKLRGNGVSNMVRLWAQTSNNNHSSSLALQEAAAKEFGLTQVAGWRGLKSANTAMSKEVAGVLEKKGEMMQAFVRAQYDATQEFFKSAGVKELEIYRGFSLSATTAPAWAKGSSVGSHVDIPLRPLSSFSYSKKIASIFSGGKSLNIIVRGVVPVEHILSTALTGNGCQHEKEVVVLGGTNTFERVARNHGEGYW